MYNTAALFNMIMKMIGLWSICKKMIEDIDKSAVLDSGVIDSPVLGKIPPVGLSGGVKTLILVSLKKIKYLMHLLVVTIVLNGC